MPETVTLKSSGDINYFALTFCDIIGWGGTKWTFTLVAGVWLSDKSQRTIRSQGLVDRHMYDQIVL